MAIERNFFLGRFTNDITESQIERYLQSKGFDRKDFSVDLFTKKAGRDCGCRLKFFIDINIMQLIERVGTSRPEIQHGRQAIILPWEDEGKKQQFLDRERAIIDFGPDDHRPRVLSEVQIQKNFFIGNLSPDVQKETITKYFISKGFKETDFELQIHRNQSLSGKCSVRVGIFSDISLSQFAEKLGSFSPQIEPGVSTSLTEWHGNTRRWNSRARTRSMSPVTKTTANHSRSSRLISSPRRARSRTPSLMGDKNSISPSTLASASSQSFLTESPTPGITLLPTTAATMEVSESFQKERVNDDVVALLKAAFETEEAPSHASEDAKNYSTLALEPQKSSADLDIIRAVNNSPPMQVQPKSTYLDPRSASLVNCRVQQAIKQVTFSMPRQVPTSQSRGEDRSARSDVERTIQNQSQMHPVDKQSMSVQHQQSKSLPIPSSSDTNWTTIVNSLCGIINQQTVLMKSQSETIALLLRKRE